MYGYATNQPCMIPRNGDIRGFFLIDGCTLLYLGAGQRRFFHHSWSTLGSRGPPLEGGHRVSKWHPCRWAALGVRHPTCHHPAEAPSAVPTGTQAPPANPGRGGWFLLAPPLGSPLGSSHSWFDDYYGNSFRHLVIPLIDGAKPRLRPSMCRMILQLDWLKPFQRMELLMMVCDSISYCLSLLMIVWSSLRNY